MRIGCAAMVAVAAVLAAGCDSGGGGGGHTTARTTPSQSATTTETAPSSSSPAPTRTGPLRTGPGVRPGETPPVLSEDAKQHTPTGALHFAEYYFSAYDWGIATTDPYLVQQISAPSCTACSRYVTGLNGLRRDSGYVKGGRIDLESTRLVKGSFRFKSDYVVAVSVAEESVVLVRPSSAPTTASTATSHDTSLVFVSWGEDRWHIVEVGAPS